MRQKYLESLISFCIGVSWVLSFSIGIYLFLHGLTISFFTAVLLFILGLSSGFLFVAFFEGLSLLQDIAAEKKEQTKILKDILSKLPASKESTDEEIPNN
ncbi:MAG: hypothetical protein AB7D29_07080 [Campylobacterales bacterium]